MNTRWRNGISNHFWDFIYTFKNAVDRLDKSLDPRDTFSKLKAQHFTLRDLVYIPQILSAVFWLSLVDVPVVVKSSIALLYVLVMLIPFTSQFFVPASPIFLWLITYFCSRFIPVDWRPPIFVALLPALESVLYGANVSDILTRFTHPVLDIMAWLPYGVIHFTFPFVVALLLWLYRPKGALALWAKVFGYMNTTGVWVQILIPCAAPWYELIYGLTPASYNTLGSAGGLERIDKFFGGNGYAIAFGNSPVVFGAFPSLHAGCATMEALFMSHFFPQTTYYIWAYAGLLYWSTMYLTHHYLIDVVGGGCLSVAFFYIFLPDEFQGQLAIAPRVSSQSGYYEAYNMDEPHSGHKRGISDLLPPNSANFDPESDASLSDEEQQAIPYRSPALSATHSNKAHRHTASIASLVRAGGDSDRDGEAWSPIAAGSLVSPRTNDADG